MTLNHKNSFAIVPSTPDSAALPTAPPKLASVSDHVSANLASLAQSFATEHHLDKKIEKPARKIISALPDFLLGPAKEQLLAETRRISSIIAAPGESQRTFATAMQTPAVSAVALALNSDRAQSAQIVNWLTRKGRSYAISPDLANAIGVAYLTLAYHESGIRDLPERNLKSTAKGPLQMLRATRQDANDMLINDKNVSEVRASTKLNHTSKQQIVFMLSLAAFVEKEWKWTTAGWVPVKPFLYSSPGHAFQTNYKDVLKMRLPGWIALMSIYTTNGRSALRKEGRAIHYPLRPSEDALLFTQIYDAYASEAR